MPLKLADMATEIELARLLLYKACWLRENHRLSSKESAMAKMFCSEMYHRVANQAVQIHGGYGLMKEYPVNAIIGIRSSSKSAKEPPKYSGSS